MSLSGTSVRGPTVMDNGCSESVWLKRDNMNSSIAGTKIAFITPPGGRAYPVAPFSATLAEGMLPASYGVLEPVWITVRDEQARTPIDSDLESVNFLIRPHCRNDYTQATDFINAGHGDAVIVQYDFALFDHSDGTYLARSLKKVDVPVVVILQNVPATLSPTACRHLMDVCRSAASVVVRSGSDYATVGEHYHLAREKREFSREKRGADLVG